MFKNKALIILSSIFTILSLLFIMENVIFNQNKKNIITKTLKSDAYVYLPNEAKEYVKTIYEKTGTILLTEKNKKKNIPYLNPKYVKYLALNEIEKKEIDLIPKETVLDYVMPKKNNVVTNTNDNLPSSYDLRNVDGKKFVTPSKDQGGLGLCWAFGTMAQAESYLLVKNNTSYSTSSQIFSERQMDYATAIDGMIDGETLYSFSRFLGDGGNFTYARSVITDGLGLADISWKTYDDTDFAPMEFNKIYNYGNSKYEIEETLEMPILDFSSLDLTIPDDINLRNNYLNTLKETIVSSGGLYIGTGDPSGYCSYEINGSRFIYEDGTCNNGGHAMQIIGWDDNVEYSFCSGKKNSRNYYYIDKNTTGCDEENIISGTGAWIVKNSWGETYPYVYVAYNSLGTDYNAITKMNPKNWDNIYGNSENLGHYYNSSVNRVIEKKLAGNEKINSVKIGIGNQNKTFKLYIGKDINSAILIDTITSTQPGVYTFDLLEKNIVMSGTSFYVKITSNDGGLLSPNDTIIVTTNNVESSPQVTTYDTSYKPYISTDNFFKIRIESDVIDIAEGEQINYKVLDSNYKEITSNYTVTENVVSANKVFSKIVIDNDLQLGNYIIQSIYNNEVLCESTLTIDRNIVMTNGSGTQNDPYLITSALQLDLIRTNIFAYYKLLNDIDLTYDTSNVNGLFYNDGAGWEPIRYKYSSGIGYSGGLDGNNHKIIGLYIYRPNENYVGLFSRLENENYSNLYVKNLTFEKANVLGNQYVGILAGLSNGTTYERCLTLNGIALIDSLVRGDKYIGGISGELEIGTTLTGYCVATGKLRHQILNLYSNVNALGNHYVGGLFGRVTTLSYNNSPGIMSNLLSFSNVSSITNKGELIGAINLEKDNPLIISNAISLGNTTNGFIDGFTNASNEKLTLTNIYYLNDVGIEQNENIIMNNVSKKSMSELKNSSNYSTWIDFSTNWNIATINNIVRYPILNFMDFEYLDIPNINLDLSDNKTIELNSIVTPNYKTNKGINYKIEDTSIASIENGIVTALKAGTTTMHVISNYDGFEKDIIITVTQPTKYTITFDSNGGSEVDNIVGYETDEVNMPANPTKNGYVFGGWYTDNNTFNNEYTSNIMGSNNITLYAKWDILNYSITYDKNNGSDIVDGDTTYNIEKRSILLPSIPTKMGYTFSGWKLTNCKDNWTINSVYNGDIIELNNNYGNITLKAIWSPVKTSTVLNANMEGVFDYTTAIDIEYDSSSINVNKLPQKENYSFEGYYTESVNGIMLIDSNGNLVNNKGYVTNSKWSSLLTSLTLYAHWSEIKIVVKNYNIDNNNINNIKSSTTLSDYLKNFEVSSNIAIEVYKNNAKVTDNNTKIATGSVVKIYQNNSLIKEYTNIIKGDNNGDGQANLADLSKLYNHYRGNIKMTSIYLNASDLNNDNNVNLADLSKMYNYYRGNIKSL